MNNYEKAIDTNKEEAEGAPQWWGRSRRCKPVVKKGRRCDQIMMRKRQKVQPSGEEKAVV